MFGRRAFTSPARRPRTRSFLLGGAIIAPFGISLYPSFPPQLVENHQRIFARCTPNTTVLSLLTLKAVVFLLWQLVFRGSSRYSGTISKLTKFMHRHFVIYPHHAISWRRWHTPLTSMFCHATRSHLLSNAFALWILGGLQYFVGVETLLTIYLGGGTLGLLAQAFWDRSIVKSTLPIHGASGGGSALAMATYCWLPNKDIRLDFIAEGFTLPKMTLLLLLFSYDVVGLVLGWQKLAHVAHLTGALFGYAAFTYLSQTVGTTQHGEMLIATGVYEGPIKNFYPTGNGGVLHTERGDFLVRVDSEFDLRTRRMPQETEQ